MEFMTLTIELPRLSGEQAAMVQQTLYSFLDAFDTYYSFAIERYHQNEANPDYINKLVSQLLSNDDPL